MRHLRAGLPRIAVDGVLLQGRSILLVRRGRPPFRGHHALPGGFVEPHEQLEVAVVREIGEETGLRTRVVRLLGVFSGPGRDPRGPTVSVVFELASRSTAEPRGADDAASARFVPLADLPPLAFDHARILKSVLDGRGGTRPGGSWTGGIGRLRGVRGRR